MADRPDRWFFGFVPRDGPTNLNRLTSALIVSHRSSASRSFVLTSLRALHLDTFLVDSSVGSHEALRLGIGRRRDRLLLELLL
jgi:hypothetical protein